MRVVGAEKDAADDKSDDNRRGLQDKAAVQCCCWSTQRCRTYRAVLCSLSDHFAFRVRFVPPSAKVRDEEGSREGRKGRSGRRLYISVVSVPRLYGCSQAKRGRQGRYAWDR